MSVTIHYKGKINDIKLVDQLTTEIKDIAETMNWDYFCLNEDWQQQPDAQLVPNEKGQMNISGHAGLKGISFSPHEKCERVWLMFDAKGNLSSPINVALADTYENPNMQYWLDTKTQFAGAEAHIAICKLFRYIQKRYIYNLEVTDEGRYWEYEDLDFLKQCFRTVEEGIQMLTATLSSIPRSPHDNEESLVRKIEEALRRLGFEEEPEE